MGDIGWPISEADVRPYYRDIFQVMGVNALPFTDEFLERFKLREAVQSPDVRVRFSKFAPFTKRNLAKTLGRQCLASGRVKVFFHANAVALNVDAAGARVESVTCRNYRDGVYTFKAREFIISSGTIESSRLLLSSTSAAHPAGLGNGSDQVGRYFHDHVTVGGALWLGEISKPKFAKYFSPYYVKNTLHSPKLEATPALHAKLHLPEVMAHFFIHESDNNEFALLRQTLVDLQRGSISSGTMRKIPLLVSGIAQMAWSLKVKGRRVISPQANISLNIETEQVPRADSRIQISDQRNAVGIPETIVDWKVSDEDGESMRRFAGAIDTYLKSLGLTQLDWKPGPTDDARTWAQAGEDILHPMGGTRMGASPATSVVDADLRVHGVANLSVASCSVFPSGGSSNPTFTMMALACRLADALEKRWQK